MGGSLVGTELSRRRRVRLWRKLCPARSICGAMGRADTAGAGGGPRGRCAGGGPGGPHAGGKRLQLIAEIKKASPSKGRLVAVLEHRALARTYTIGGAAGISVLTERKHFQGELQHMLDVRVSMKGYYPGGRPSTLRKDFLFDPYHLWEARAYGADAVLLIPAS